MSHSCDLCGLPLRHTHFTSSNSDRTFRFCCMGCRQVFHMLLEGPDGASPESFREQPVFKKCRELGIIPGSESELDLPARPQRSRASTHFSEKGPEGEGNPEGSAREGVLSLGLTIKQMWCPACAWVIEAALKKSRGVVGAACNFSTDRARFEYNPVLTSPARIIQSIKELGYEASIPGEAGESREKKREFIRFAVSAFLTANVMMFSFALYSDFLTPLSRETLVYLSWPIFFMASVVFFYGGRNIYRRAWAGITAAAFSMETLITVGSFTAYLYSTFNLLHNSPHLYYDTSSMLITLVLLGKAMERKAKGEVQEGLENFFSLRPKKVRICTDLHPEGRYVDSEHLREGDVFRVEEGEILPADGLLLAGQGPLDESSLTGEPAPVFKRAGERVKSGSKVIQGILKVRAEGVGEASTLGQMIRIMERALENKTPFEGKTDFILQWFVPVILLLGVGTGAVCLLSGLSFDEAMTRAVTVIVISCPCTLGVAIPLTRVAGISLAGRKGILVRDFSSFEKTRDLNAFVFDKTGTVTTGQWTLQQVIPFGPFTEEQVLAAAAALEQASDNYIAAEIKRAAEKARLDPVRVERVNALENGITGRIGEEEIKIGSKAFLKKEWAGYHEPIDLAPLSEQGHSLVFMSTGGRPCAVLVFGDRVREGATTAIRILRERGQNIYLLSGDGDQTTKAVGREVGIEEAYGGKMPLEKVSFVGALQKKGHRVAMVGDGVNDAPAMSQADLAVAVHSGSHLGKETADITLMGGHPGQLLDFLGLAKRVNSKIYQNLVFAFFYNVISIPVAMSGLLNPLIAVSAMLMSSLSVVGNTLLLVKGTRGA